MLPDREVKGTAKARVVKPDLMMALGFVTAVETRAPGSRAELRAMFTNPQSDDQLTDLLGSLVVAMQTVSALAGEVMAALSDRGLEVTSLDEADDDPASIITIMEKRGML